MANDTITITPLMLRRAFDLAEGETADHFPSGQTCGLLDRNGEHTCPICYFRRRVKAALGIVVAPKPGGGGG